MERPLIPLPLNFLGSPAGTSRTLSASGIIAPKVMQKTFPSAHPASSILLSRAVAYLLCNGRTWLSSFRHPALLHSPPLLRHGSNRNATTILTLPVLAASSPAWFQSGCYNHSHPSRNRYHISAHRIFLVKKRPGFPASSYPLIPTSAKGNRAPAKLPKNPIRSGAKSRINYPPVENRIGQ